MASSAQQPHEDPTYGLSKVKVTILASEWGSSKGGLSTINRELAIQLAKCPEAEITVFLPQCSEEDKKLAVSHNVTIVEATPRPGYEELDWLTFPPKELQIDVVVGHGVKLGRQAQIIRDSHNCKWIQVAHTDPEELGMFKVYENPISKGEEKHHVEVQLCEKADFVVGIGPKLTEAFRSSLRGFGKDQNIHDLTPGIFDEFQSVQQAPDERENCRILVFGRGDAEDFELKGFDIAARAVASLPNAHLSFVGAPDGKHEEIAARFLQCGIPRHRLKVRGYVNSRVSLKHLFCEVDLALMPSRTEGFGLTGLEALSAGLPVLVSRNSGFGQALSKVPFGKSYVIDSEEHEVWAAAITEIWNKDREERLDEADTLRASYGKKYNWAKQSKDLLQKMIDLTRDLSSSCHSSAPSAARMFPCATQGSQWTGDMSVCHPGKNTLDDLQQMKCQRSMVTTETDLSVDLGRIVSGKGFVISNSPASGNCMFFALSEQLLSVKGIRISQTELRKTLVRFLRENPNLRDETPLFNFVSGYSSWADYLQSMSKDGTWGDHLVLLAAANCYQTPILVISSLGHEIAINPEHPVATLNSNPLLLGHVHEQHYVGLHPRKRASSRKRKGKKDERLANTGAKVKKTVDKSVEWRSSLQEKSDSPDDSSGNETTNHSRGIAFPFCPQASEPSDDMTGQHEASSYPANIIERIRQLYKIREERLLPLPWCDDCSFHLNDIFTRLKIVSKEKTRGTFTDEITDMTAIFKAHENCKKPRTVLIEGDPGMGKTTYCQKVAYDWATKQEQWDDSFPEIEVLLLLRCHDIKSDIWEAINAQILPNDVDEEARRTFFKFIRENQSKVLLVLDGLDEADPSKLEMYISLLESKMLAGCNVVVTSRHETGKKVRRYMDTVWEIVGFRENDANDFIRKYFTTQKHLADKLLKRLSPLSGVTSTWKDYVASKDLRELTTNPLNTALLCVLWEDFKGDLPENRTELYIEIVSCVLRRYEKKNGIFSSNSEDPITVYNEELTHLGRMALQSLLQGELYIEEHKFDSSSTVLLKFGFLSILSGGSKRKPCSRYGFLHKSFQEFFAGLYLASQILNGELDCDSVVTDQRYWSKQEEMLLFMSGILSSRSEETTVSLVTSIAEHINSSPTDNIPRNLELAFDCIMACKTPEKNLHPHLLHIFGQNLNFKTLNVWDLDDEQFDLLCESLKVNTCLTGLYLFDNDIGASGAASLSEALKVNTCLTELNLSGNNIGDSGAASLSEALKVNTCLTKLSLFDNNIGDSGAASLFEALKVNTCLTELNLGGNNIGDSGAASLSEALKVNSCLTKFTF